MSKDSVDDGYQVMNCPRCARLLREGAQFCDACGSSMAGAIGSEDSTASLDQATDRPGERTDDRTGDAHGDKAGDDARALVGRTIGGKYSLTALLGEGGMGSVYRARRLHIGDEVAVKVLHREYVNEPKTVERFRREAQAAAMIRHPSVVAIHDFSEGREGEPAYIVMELVDGRTLRKILESEGRLRAGRAVAIMREICKGVGAAHRLNVVHRDIKPDNIMILPPDSDEQRERVKVVDFGIAKLRDMAAAQTLTQTGRVIGTVYYMSPEQCCAESLDARSDVYSLGAVLYEMLAGAPPFVAETATAIVAKHLSEPPPPLPKEAEVPREVEAVLRRALAKEPQSRQNDATAFGKELGAAVGSYDSVTTSERVPPDTQATTAEQTRKGPPHDAGARGEAGGAGRLAGLPRWVGALALAAILIALVAFGFARRTRIEQSSATPTPTPGGPTAGNTSSWQPRVTLRTNSKVYSVAFAPDDRTLATASSEGLREESEFISEVRLWDAATGELKRVLTEHSEGVLSVAFSADGRFLVSATGSGSGASKLGKVKLWDAQTGQLMWAVGGHRDFATGVCFSPDGASIASGSLDRTVRLWDAQTGQLRRSLPLAERVYAIAFSPDGKLLAIASQKAVELRDIESGEVRLSLTGNEYAVRAVSFSADGQTIAGGDVGGGVELWDAATGALKQTLSGHGDVVDALAFAPDGKALASGSYDSTVIIWNLQNMTRLATLQEADKVTSVAFSHDGRALASGGWAKTVRLWQ